MLIAATYLAAVAVGSDTLPNEQTVLDRLQGIWRAATGGANNDLEVSTRRRSEAGPFGGLNLWSRNGQKPHQSSSQVLYRLGDGTVVSAQFDRERETAHLPVLPESLLRERALTVVALLAPSRFSVRCDGQGFTEDRSEFDLTWSYVCDGYPTHRNPIQLRLDARTSKPIRLHAPSFNWRTDPAVKPRFSEEHCYQVAWAKYMEVKPMAVAPESHFGLRWVGADVEQDPALVAKATIPFAYWASDKYRSHNAEKRAVLAYSFWFGWQCVLVDAVTGEPMMVYGIDLDSQGRSSAAPPPTDPVIGRTWHLVTNPKVVGKLEPVDVKAETTAGTKLVGLSGDKLALVGHYDAKTRTLKVEHPSGTRHYRATGELARALER